MGNNIDFNLLEGKIIKNVRIELDDFLVFDFSDGTMFTVIINRNIESATEYYEKEDRPPLFEVY